MDDTPQVERKPPKSGGWFWLENSSLDVAAECGAMAFTVLSMLASHADSDGTCFPSVARMAERLRASRRTVQRALKDLENVGVIRVTKRKTDRGADQSHLFRLAHPCAISAQGGGCKIDAPPVSPVSPPGVSKQHRGRVSNEHHEQDSVLTRLNEQDSGEQENTCSSDDERFSLSSLSTVSGSKKRKAKADYSRSFSEWWAVYPRKVAKDDALKAFAHAIKRITEANGGTDKDSLSWLLERTIEFAKSDKGNGSYCPHPSTWLNGGRYADDPATWKANGDSRQPAGVRGYEYKPTEGDNGKRKW